MISALAAGTGAIPRPALPTSSPGVVVEVTLDPRTLRLRSEVRDATSNRVLLRLGPQPDAARPTSGSGLDITV